MPNEPVEESVLSDRSDSWQRIYTNDGNPAVIKLLSKGCRMVLDIGRGAGDGAVLVRRANPECRVFGIARSPQEPGLAQIHIEQCWVFDIEGELPSELASQSFDALIFSHVLEHLREPDATVARSADLQRAWRAVPDPCPRCGVLAV